MASLRSGTAVAYLAVYAVAAYAGLAASQQSGGLAIFWPASGVAALWLLRGATRGQVVLDGLLLVVGTVVVDLAMDIPRGGAAGFAVANLTMAVTIRAASALSESRAFWGPLPRRVSRKRDLLVLGLASLAAAVLSAPFGLAAAYDVAGELSWGTALTWLVRNTCSTLLVCAAVLGMLTAVHRGRRRGSWPAIFTPEPRRSWVLELVAASAVTLTGAVFLFATGDHLPVAFLLLLVSTWIGYRFTPAVGGVQSLVLGTLVVLCTQEGRGSFAAIDDPTARAVVAQVYVMATAVMVLVISLGVVERNRLIARVRDSEARATSRAELLDAVMNVMTDGLVVLEESGAVMMRNPAAEQLMGPRRGAGEDSPDEYGLFQLDGSSIEPGQMPHVRALAGEPVTAEDVLRIDPGTGRQSILSVGALPLRSTPGDGDPMAVVVIHDVTQERTQRRELQAFAGTVAHDLKAPLTGVGSWAEILGDQLDGLGVDVTAPRSSLRRIETSAARMQQLIADLLAYSQAQSALLSPVSLSLTGMVEDVARELRSLHADVRPVIEHGPLGQVYADRTLVGQLLTNVIGNAVKYVAPGTTPRVLITSELVGDMLEVRVADNGIGIPRAERGRIFDSFYRASSSGSYPGTGLGLAICARAIERHGGRISAREGLEGRGTTLVFTLPADLEPDVDPSAGDQGDGETTSAEPPPLRTGSETAVR